MGFYPFINGRVHTIVYEASKPEDRDFMNKMDKNDVNQVNGMLIQNLYASILDRKYIDFGDIPSSKGDIESVKYYENTCKCLEIMEEIIRNNHITDDSVSQIKTCMNHIKSNKKSFMDGFKTNDELIMLVYNSMVLACVDATSTLTSEYVDYIVNATDPTYHITGRFDSKRGIVHMDSIKQFNKLADEGKLANTLRFSLTDTRSNFMGEEIVIPIVVVAALLSIIPIIREIIFFYYNSRVKMSDYLDMQADFLESNKLAVEASNRPPNERKEIVKKQAKVIKRLRDRADKIKIKNVDTQDVVKKEIKDENSLWSLGKIETQLTKNKLAGDEMKFI